MRFYTSKDINNFLSFPALIEALRTGFTKEYTIPNRMHLDYDNPEDANQNTLLLMPAVSCGDFAGVKIVNVSIENGRRNLPSIQGIYYLLDAITGEPKAIFDAKSLTNWRTAAASALAADFLARADASRLLMIGTGSLAPFLIDAHATTRPIKELFIYGRSKQKAETLAKSKAGQFEKIEVVDDLDNSLSKADIVSSATFSETPLVTGQNLRSGQHIDLVGAFKPTSRESDDEVMRRPKIYVDSMETALKEAGDLAIPLASGVISAEDIKGDLFALSSSSVVGRESDSEITCFKSVGHALEDLVAAQLVLNNDQS
ncbi:MAG: ornithine cyclodeaminase family protein [Cyclobacteriaceae bacterium]